MTEPHPAVVAVAKARAERETMLLVSWSEMSDHVRKFYCEQALADICAFLDATREPSEGLKSHAAISISHVRDPHSLSDDLLDQIAEVGWGAFHDQLRREVLGDE